MLKTLSALAAVAAASVLVLPTVSQADEMNSVRVSYSDLDLATGVGQHTLQRRIAGAAREVCVIEDRKDLEIAMATLECRNGAIAGAEPAYAAAVAAARHPSVTVVGMGALIVAPR
jgi:UrcA family protein